MWPFGDKNKRNGFTFSDKRVKELEEVRSHLLTEYDYIDAIKHTKKRVIRLSDKFSDARELIAFYDLKPENCVCVLGYCGEHMYDLNTVPLIHKDIAGVFATHEKDKKISFPDGIGEHVNLYNVEVVDKNENRVNVPKKHSDLFNLPSKTELTRLIFGKTQRQENLEIEKTLLSLDVIDKKNHLYFYLATKASAEVRENFFNFKDKYFELKEKSTFTDRVYPTVPDEVHGGSFDWDKAYKDNKDGVEVGKFYGHFFYEILSSETTGLSEVLSKEYERVRFVEQFPRLEDKLSSQGSTNRFGELGKYAYVPIDRARYDYYSATELRGTTDRAHCFWDGLLRDIESIYEKDLPSAYLGGAKEKQAAKNTELFYNICEEMISGSADDDNDIISYINLNSSKNIEKQISKGTTFSFIKMPIIDSQNEEVIELINKTITERLKNILDTKMKDFFISSDICKNI
ncbi:MAG: hypothetical protein U9Q66_00670 [Patescibacteria group bacterium]|nr:hypothetical protein [Patescibacteria group bacterium]